MKQPPGRPVAVISEADFERFRDHFYRKTGIHFESNKRYFVDKRLSDRMQSLGYEHFRDYFNHLRFDRQQELQALINLMTVNETYFFREVYQLKCLVNSMLDELVQHKRRGDRVRIWSMPCSTGEEPYSIAMMLLEEWPALQDWDVEILASDIDTAALDRARTALYEQRAVHSVPAHYLQRYFRPIMNNGRKQYQLKDDIKESVGFSRVNLHSTADVRALGPLDVVFCRNLLIYFDEMSRRQAAEKLFDALVPGGFICLGHSESMSRISPLFRARRFPDAMVYQK
ncbi:MAG: protein-glutamate O-methyltransferase CheR [Natronospirillum sp.]|uniref:CheR family methyltransferase n=1 Tax=Natronospirillum sp. TaxID=2812955 RepID=UPI0025FC7C6D|nr:protein-glutamate O-methyltransferase CheR [Natronospirillum sp.]MCH8550392.1 protein-glutamate O-methyltransferase CheR [Natronospirillum sp.]